MYKPSALRLIPYLLFLAYIIFVALIFYKFNARMDFLLTYPVRVSHEVSTMQTRLKELENSLPALLAASNLSMETISEIVHNQEEEQDKSFAQVKKYFHGDPAMLDQLGQEFEKIRKVRMEVAEKLLNVNEFEKAATIYEASLKPQVAAITATMSSIMDSAMHRLSALKTETEYDTRLSLFVASLMGIFIVTIFYINSKKERKKTEMLAAREQIFNTLSYNVAEVFIVASNLGTFDYVTSNSQRIIGISDHELLAQPQLLYNFLPADAARWLQEILERGSLEQEEEYDFTGNGGLKSFKLTVSPIKGNSYLSYIIGLRDQTRTMQYQQALTDALANAHAASKAKSSFLSHMSHEIRTPMNAIIGMTTIALSKLDNKERVEDCLTKIGVSSRHLLGLINDILDMSKIENGKLNIAHEPFSLPRAIQNIIDLVRPQAQAKHLEFEITQDNVDTEELIGDDLRLNQILLNILSNALKFTPPGGLVSLNIKQMLKTGTTVSLRFTITDNGIGMSEEFLQRLYNPFEQATDTTTAKYGGTGLGMSITLSLITLMGGTINVESKEGHGSKFTVELPFGFQESSGTSQKGLPPLKVLVVDDDYGTCEHASLLLEKMGLQVRWCTRGEEAVQMIKEAHESGTRYDVCFIDWKMPDMDGAATARRIRSEVGDNLLIIIISAYDWSPIEEEAKASGVTDFVAKPFFASTLYNVLISTTQKLGVVQELDEPEAHFDFTGKRILLVEDNEFNRDIANEFLDMVHAEVENAENGQEAVDMFNESESGYYDLILMDVQMPVMDGYEATRTIRSSEHPDAASIPILAMTANAFSEDIANAVAAGMNGHIAKPIDINELYRAIMIHLTTTRNGS